MTTLLFCTSYADNALEWRLRYRRWADSVAGAGVFHDRLAIIDDGSPEPPDWARVIPVGDDGAFGLAAPPGRPAVEMYRHPRRLGRHDIQDFPGWYRSFAFSAVLARRMGARKIVHVESDASITSREMVDFINGVREGWVTPYSAMHGFPEMAIQVVAGAALDGFCDLFAQPYDWLRGRHHEDALPFTHVVRSLVGDRYAGGADVPRDTDFVTQTPSDRPPGFYWWDAGLGSSAPTPCAPPPNPAFQLDFKTGGNAFDVCGTGWGITEPQFRWAVGRDSYVTLPAEARACPALVLDVWPCVDPVIAPLQTLELHLDGVEIGRFKLKERQAFRVALPAGWAGPGVLRLHHPDAVRATAVDPACGDHRELSVAVFSISGVAA